MSDKKIRLLVWDMGDPEPEGVQWVVSQRFCDQWCQPIAFSRADRGGWNGYAHGVEECFDWPELLRRFGPVAEVKG